MAKENPKRTSLPKKPFNLGDRGAFIRKALVAVKVSKMDVAEILAYELSYDRVVMIRVIADEIALDHNSRRQYSVEGDETVGGSEARAVVGLQWLRDAALRGGATPDAIRLLGTVKPFTKKEEVDMAEKLKNKADTKALKTAANKTPVGGAKASANKGNAAALAKARAAKGPDNRKIKVLNKKPAARENSYRARMLADLIASKTVQEFRDRDKAYTAGDVGYAVKAGIISVA